LLDAGNSIREPGIFDIPLHMSVLCGDMAQAQRLARALEKLPEQSGQMCYEYRMRMFAALIQNNGAAFDQWQAAYRASKTFEFDQKYLKLYIDLYAAVRAREANAYTKLCQAIAANFLVRAKDRKAEQAEAHYGGGIENNFVVDFMALSVAAIAHRHGMTTTLDTVYFPQSLFQRILAAQG
jgi:hypothetical protein